mmetsp:Transcript_38071/g.95002  ORF Transcript_38071/g.95002 Transcript_38071/m.95002 type:complete len:200 (+) Transcript_38071:864-1463(+)
MGVVSADPHVLPGRAALLLAASRAQIHDRDQPLVRQHWLPGDQHLPLAAALPRPGGDRIPHLRHAPHAHHVGRLHVLEDLQGAHQESAVHQDQRRLCQLRHVRRQVHGRVRLLQQEQGRGWGGGAAGGGREKRKGLAVFRARQAKAGRGGGASLAVTTSARIGGRGVATRVCVSMCVCLYVCVGGSRSPRVCFAGDRHH